MVPSERLTPFLLVACAVCLTVTGELFLKSGMNRVGIVSFDRLVASVLRAAGTPQIWIGFFFVFAGAMLWLTAISRAPLSWAYPILALGYLLVLLFSKIALGESVPMMRWVGTLIIIGGVWLVFRS